MLKLYYRIWADAIVYEQTKKSRVGSWKPFALISMSILQGINLFFILMLLRLLSHNKFLVIFPMGIFNIKLLNIYCSIIITYFVPFFIINYLLIFNNDRYKFLLKEYGDKKGKLYGIYALVSIGVIVVPLALKLVFG